MTNNTTRLIYLWIDDYKLFKNAEFYFTDEYKIKTYKVPEDSLYLEIKKTTNTPNILSETYPNTPITNCSIIIGENGSGKTSLAEIFNLITANDDKLKYCLILQTFDKEWKLQYKSNMEILGKNDFPRETEPISFSAVYYSPCYTSTHTMKNNDSFIDISTTNMLKLDYSIYAWEIEKLNYIKNDPFLGHRIRETGKIASLLNYLQSNTSENLRELKQELPIPSILTIHPISIKYMSENANDWNIGFNDFLYDVSKTMQQATAMEILESKLNTSKEKYNSKDYFLDYVAINLYNSFLVSTNRMDFIFYDDLEASSLSIFQYIYHEIDCTITRITEEHNSFKENNNYLVFMDFLKDLSPDFFSYDKYEKFPFLEIDIKSNLSILTKFVDLYQKCCSIDFLKLDFFPTPSSGEYNLLILFARLYSCKEEIERQFTILYLDEVEATLHYSLQMKIVNLVILFINAVFQNAKKGIQLIFSSHSPLMLSDFPSGTVIKLQTEKTESIGPKFADRKRISVINDGNNLFGANLYQLCSDGFLIKDSVMGNFSKKVLADIIDGKYSDNPDFESKLIESFADPVIKILIRNSLKYNNKEVDEI